MLPLSSLAILPELPFNFTQKNDVKFMYSRKHMHYSIAVKPHYRRDQRGIGSLATIGAFVGIGIVFLIIFMIANSGGTKINTNKDGANKTNSTATSNSPSPPNGQPAVIRIPDNFSIFSNTDYGISFAYPTPWGKLTGTGGGSAAYTVTSTVFSNYAIGNSVLNGQMTAVVYNKDKFQIITKVGGALLTAVKLGDTYGWKVVQTGANEPTLNVGDSVDIKSSKNQSGTTIFDFSINDKNQIQGRWVFEAKNRFVIVALPPLTRLDGSAPSGSDLVIYTAVGNNMARTMRPTN